MATIGTPQFVNDTVKLFGDMTTWLILISIAVGVFLFGFFAFQWYSADVNDKPTHAKKIKTVIMGVIIVVVAETVIKLILGYYMH